MHRLDKHADVVRQDLAKHLVNLARIGRQRAALRQATSEFINRYINAVELTWTTSRLGKRKGIDDELRAEVDMLKQLTWCYVIENPSLATQQYGQRQVVRGLFVTFMDAANNTKKHTIFPIGYEEELARVESEGRDKDGERARVVTDFIASMTEQQALDMYRRITGTSLGSVLDPSAL